MKLARHIVLKVVVNSVSTPFTFKLKEAMRIIWRKPSLNKQQKHVIISIIV